MWEIYSQTKDAIAIKTTAHNLVNSLDITQYRKKFIEFILSTVDYRPSKEIKGKLKYSSPFFIKRPHFKYESEARLFLSSYSSYKPNLETPLGYIVPIDLSKGIDEILVHPDAQEWFLKSIQELVKVFHLEIPVKKGVCGNSI